MRVGRRLSSSATLSVPHSDPEEVLEGVQAGMGMVSSRKVALEGGANVITIGASILAQEIRCRFTRDFVKGVP